MQFGEIVSVIGYADIIEKHSHAFLKGGVPGSKLTVFFLWLCIPGRHLFFGDAVDVWQSVMSIQGYARFAVRTIVTSERYSTHIAVIGLIA